MALKPALISRFCSARQLRCTATAQWTAQDGPQQGFTVYPTLLSQPRTHQARSLSFQGSGRGGNLNVTRSAAGRGQMRVSVLGYAVTLNSTSSF